MLQRIVVAEIIFVTVGSIIWLNNIYSTQMRALKLHSHDKFDDKNTYLESTTWSTAYKLYLKISTIVYGLIPLLTMEWFCYWSLKYINMVDLPLVLTYGFLNICVLVLGLIWSKEVIKNQIKRIRRRLHHVRVTSPAKHTSNTFTRCIHFSSGGVYFWWQAGVAKYIQEHFDTEDLIAVGSSAGSLTATLLKTGGCFDTALSYAVNMVDRYNIRQNPLGLAGVWGGLVSEWLYHLIPDTIKTFDDKHIHIAASPLNPFSKPYTLSDFPDKHSLINACLTSCHIPFFMNGNFAYNYNGRYFLDGSTWEFVGGIFHNEAWPEKCLHELSPDEIFYVDWRHDEKFVSTWGSMTQLTLITTETLVEMMDSGYEYMKRQVQANKFRLKRKVHYLHK